MVLHLNTKTGRVESAMGNGLIESQVTMRNGARVLFLRDGTQHWVGESRHEGDIEIYQVLEGPHRVFENQVEIRSIAGEPARLGAVVDKTRSSELSTYLHLIDHRARLEVGDTVEVVDPQGVRYLMQVASQSGHEVALRHL